MAQEPGRSVPERPAPGGELAHTTGRLGSVAITRNTDLDGGKLTIRMSLLAIAARPFATQALAARHDGRTRIVEP